MSPASRSGYCPAMPRLRRTSPDQPGWTRRRAGQGVRLPRRARPAAAEEEAQRVRDLVIPPAWQDVWITPYENGHLQAVGTDDAGRRQYLYHPQWRERRDAEKFDRMLLFGKALAKARERVLARPRPRGHAAGAGLRGRRAAARPRLLPDRQRRVRRRERLLRPHHARAAARPRHQDGLRLRLHRQVRRRARDRDRRRGGRSRRSRSCAVGAAADDDRLLAYKNGRSWRVAAARPVNDYVRESTGLEATAKDFRTWHATVLAAAALAETPEPGETQGLPEAGGVRGDEGGRGSSSATPRPWRARRTSTRGWSTPTSAAGPSSGPPGAATTPPTSGRPRWSGPRSSCSGSSSETSPWSRATSPSRTSTPSSTPPTAAMRGGGGVDGAIHRAGGPAVLEDCVARFPDGLGHRRRRLDHGRRPAGAVGDPRGRARTGTPAQTDRSLLTSCYARALEVADELGARTVAFPLVSAGVYGWPKDDADRRAARDLPAADAAAPAVDGGPAGRLRRATYDADLCQTGGSVRPGTAWRRAELRPPVRGAAAGSEALDDPVDAGGERLDVGRVDGGVHRDPQLVAAELAVGLGVDDAVGAQDLAAIAAASIGSSKSMVPITSERWAGSATYGKAYGDLSAQP